MRGIELGRLEITRPLGRTDRGHPPPRRGRLPATGPIPTPPRWRTPFVFAPVHRKAPQVHTSQTVQHLVCKSSAAIRDTATDWVAQAFVVREAAPDRLRSLRTPRRAPARRLRSRYLPHLDTALKSELFPTLGIPTMPMHMLLEGRPKRVFFSATAASDQPQLSTKSAHAVQTSCPSAKGRQCLQWDGVGRTLGRHRFFGFGGEEVRGRVESACEDADWGAERGSCAEDKERLGENWLTTSS